MIKFGTSGFRGIMGDTFTKENVKKVAEAINKILDKRKAQNSKIVIGFDNRFMSRQYAEWMSEVFCTRNTVKFYVEAMPSPAITWMTQEYDFGIAITASHNPYMYNGIKVFLNGMKECDDNVAREIEQIANSLNVDDINHIEYKKALKEKRIIESDNYQDYCNSILSNFDIEKIKKSGLKVLVNPMHGNSTKSLSYLLDKLNIDYIMQNDNIDPYFEYKLPAPYVKNLTQQAQDVVLGKYDVGFALDGDSDRFTLISSNGEIYDCNYLSAVLYYYFLTEKQVKGAIVKNKALSSLVNKVADNFGYKVYETRVGFKHVGKVLEETDAFIGAESNGIAFKNHILSKDGIFVSIAMLELLAHYKKPFHKTLEEIQKKYDFESTVLEFAYPISEQKKKEIIDLLFVKKEYPKFANREIVGFDKEEGLKINYENNYWGMIRFSGNEPVVRIFSEMKDKQECDEMFECYEKFLGISERQ